MTPRHLVVATAALSMLVGGVASAATEPAAPHDVGRARAEAVQARNEARRLAADVEAAGGPQGYGSEAFAARHAALAAKHAEHPGNAAAVHAALAAGASPSGTNPSGKVPPGQAKKAERLAAAAAALGDG